MGQKIRPSGLRLGVIQDWDSRWYADKQSYREFLLEDHKIRTFITNRFKQASISGIHIERRVGDAVRITVHSAKPGIIIGRGGSGVEQLKQDLEKLTGRRIHVNIVEIKNPDLNAELVAESVARSIERRDSFRRAIKQAAQRCMKSGAKGVRIAVSGRLGGAEIARSEWTREGSIPLHTIRADIDYGIVTARTKSGPIGVKVWVYRGDVLPGQKISRESEARAPRRGGPSRGPGRGRARMGPGRGRGRSGSDGGGA
ncbi:MAG: 30S ribosomal protein S3 [Armatimonadia bacterium]|nr:30S ribosomal protein S3 [Armatimonadia bacterium]